MSPEWVVVDIEAENEVALMTRLARLLPLAALVLLAGCTLPAPIDSIVHNEAPTTCIDDGSCAQIGEPISVVALDCHDPQGYPFTYGGPMASAPWDQCPGRTPLLQTQARGK